MGIEYDENTTGALIKTYAKQHGRRILITCFDEFRHRVYSYDDVLRKGVQCACFLKANGICKGDKVLISGPNSIEYVSLIVGASLLGASLVLVDVNTSADIVANILSAAAPRLAFTGRGDCAPLGGRAYDIDLLTELTADFSDNLDAFREGASYRVSEDDVFIYLYTSGTTRAPKCVPLTHLNIVSNVTNFAKTFSLKKRLCLLSLAPLSHSLGLTMGLFYNFRFGSSVVYLKHVSSAAILRALQTARANAILTVPAFLSLLKEKMEAALDEAGKLETVTGLRRRLSRFPHWVKRIVFRKLLACLGGQVSWVGTGAAPLSADVEAFWESLGVRVLQGYGLSECFLASVSHFSSKTPGHVGKGLSNQAIKLGDGDEILLKGPHVFEGYQGLDDENRDLFCDGYLKTGDVGRFDDEGHLFVVGRLKNAIIGPSGLNIYPEDIEDVIRQDPRVKEAVVVNAAADDSDVVLTALVIPCERVSRDRKIDTEEILNRVNRVLSSHQRVVKLSVWPENDFPRTPSMKIKRHEIMKTIRRSHRDGTSESLLDNRRAVSPQTLEDNVRLILANLAEKPVERIDPSHKLLSDLGLDSIDIVELVTIIEEKLGIFIRHEELFNSDMTVQAFVAHVSGVKPTSEPQVVIEVSRFAERVFAMVRAVTALIMPGLFRCFFKLRIRNRAIRNGPAVSHLKKEGHLIIANHTSHLDGVSMYLSQARRVRKKIIIAAAQDFFYNPDAKLRYYLMQSCVRSFPLRRHGNPREYFKVIGEALSEGHSVILFPEGTRSPNGELGAFLPSVGQLIRALDAPVLPLFIRGAYRLWPKGQRLPKLGEIEVGFGAPRRYSRKQSAYEIRDNLHQLYCRELGCQRAHAIPTTPWQGQHTPVIPANVGIHIEPNLDSHAHGKDELVQ